MTAALLLLARLLRLGFLADFLSQTVLVGFLTGVGFQVGIAVMGEMLGIQVHSRSTVVQLIEVVRGLPRLHLLALLVSAGVVFLIFAFHRLAPRIPGALIAVIGAIVVSEVFHLSSRGVQIIGPVAGGLPALGFPQVRWQDVAALIPLSASCLVVIVAQSAATSRVYAMRHHQALDENADLAGLVLANVAAGFSGTFVVNGSPTQTEWWKARAGAAKSRK